jgi:hypothetical protein
MMEIAGLRQYVGNGGKSYEEGVSKRERDAVVC